MNSARTALDHLYQNEPLPQPTQRLLENSKSNNLLIENILDTRETESEFWDKNAKASLFSVAVAMASLDTADSILFDRNGHIRAGINPTYCGATCFDLSSLDSSPTISVYWALAILRWQDTNALAANVSNTASAQKFTGTETIRDSEFIHIADAFMAIAQDILRLEKLAKRSNGDQAIVAYEELHGKYMQLSSIETYHENAFSWCITQANKCVEKISSLKKPVRSSWDSLFSTGDQSQTKTTPPPIISRSLTEIPRAEITLISTAEISAMFDFQQETSIYKSAAPQEWKMRYDNAGEIQQTNSASPPSPTIGKESLASAISAAPSATLYGPDTIGMRQRRHSISKSAARPGTPPSDNSNDETLKPKAGGKTPPREPKYR